MLTPFLEASSKPKSHPPEQLAVLLRSLLISPARTPGPFVFQLGEFPYLYLPSSSDSLFYGQGRLEAAVH